MGGTLEDSSRSPTISRGEPSGGPDGARSPVLGGMSEAELDAIVSQLRTDKNLALAPTKAASGPWGALTEQLLESASGPLDPRESEAARAEAARHAWHIALGEHVVGPLDLAALRTHWERGELGPDSLCWRKGFEGWKPLCRIPGLAEFLAPRPDTAPATPEDLVPSHHTPAPAFLLKGAEALLLLAEDVPPPLPRRSPTLPPPFLEPEPVTAPALEPEPETQPEAPQARDAAGTHAVLSAPPPTQVEVRVRGGAWLALGGGLVGGMLMACLVWLLGLSAALSPASRGALLGPASRGASPEANTSTDTARAVASAPSPVPASTAALPAPVVSKPDVTGLVPASNGSSSIGSATITVTSTRPPAPLTRSAPLGIGAVEAPKRAITPERTVVQDPSLRKLAKAAVSPQPEPSAEESVASEAAATEDMDDDLGLDEDFARELSTPTKGAAPAKRTVWVPPALASAEPPASLAESDIFSSVVANKADITECVSAQKLQSEDGSRRVVVRWSILPSGKVTEVVTETARLQGTPLALCLEAKIRSWTFPKHREQGGPVRFPFVF